MMNCDRDCLNCPYPEFPRSCANLPLTQWERQVLKEVHHGTNNTNYVRKPEAQRMSKRGILGPHADKQACIRSTRKRCGLSLRELAALIGCTSSTLWGWERGHYRADWDRLCAVLPELEQYRPKEEAP